MANDDRCKMQLMPRGVYRFRRCERKATRDGFCKQHHPDTVAEKRAKKDERDSADQKAKRALSNRRKRNAKMAALVPELMMALEACSGDTFTVTDGMSQSGIARNPLAAERYRKAAELISKVSKI